LPIENTLNGKRPRLVREVIATARANWCPCGPPGTASPWAAAQWHWQSQLQVATERPSHEFAPGSQPICGLCPLRGGPGGPGQAPKRLPGSACAAQSPGAPRSVDHVRLDPSFFPDETHEGHQDHDHWQPEAAHQPARVLHRDSSRLRATCWQCLASRPGAAVPIASCPCQLISTGLCATGKLATLLVPRASGRCGPPS
jgi:hypothetical protein